MINTDDLFSKMASGMAASGLFVATIQHEPKAAPSPSGVTGAVWSAGIVPASESGMTSMSIVLTFQCRIYSSMMAEPQDGIDPAVLAATDAFIAYLCSDFDLCDTVRMIDFYGNASEGLRTQSGYLTQDKMVFRVMDVFVPIIINDAYPFS